LRSHPASHLGVSGGARFPVFARGVSHFYAGLRGRFLWWLPAFKEAGVSRIGAALTLLLKNGVNFRTPSAWWNN